MYSEPLLKGADVPTQCLTRYNDNVCFIKITIHSKNKF